DELAVLLYQAKRRGLDPMLGQIRGIKRWNQAKGREVMAVQTSIDAFRLIADRTGAYGGGPAPEFEMTETREGGRDLLCRFTVRKLCGSVSAGWTWLDVTDEARFSEYAGRNKNGQLGRMWKEKPHVMLAKCAESKTLRRAFPEDLGHLYTDDEMGQADNPPAAEPYVPLTPEERATVRAVEDLHDETLERYHSKMDDANKTEEEIESARDEMPTPTPIETTFHTPDEHQQRRFRLALNHDPTLSQNTKAVFLKRAGVTQSGRAFDNVCLELERMVGLAGKVAQDGLPMPETKQKQAANPVPPADGSDLPF
ncbi:MAG TPA: phage recombination protein Bet, partial [Thermoleophilia bacterium]|nr:phage recombination protein Bet [Thermoleophilia bacterium]